MFLLKHQRNSGFTLVEFIVVISIFAILSTISFITYTNMLSDARNSVRKTDMSEMKVRLRGAAQKMWAFPKPTNPIILSNSGYLAVTQGWSDSIETDNGWSFRVDPKTNGPYLYATVTNRQRYQLGMTFELGSDAFSSYVDGDYISLVPNIFPSLLLATAEVGTLEVHDTVGAGTTNRTKFIVNNGTLNLPYHPTWGPIATATTFSGIISESGVRLPWTSNYSSCQDIYEAGKSMGPGEYLIMSSTGSVNLVPCDMGSSPRVDIYPGCNTPDIVLANGQSWAACNVGATTAFSGQTLTLVDSSATGWLTTLQKSYMGGYFQWWRNDDVTQWAFTGTLASTGSKSNTVGHADFITNSTSPNDWIAAQDDTLWWGALTTLTGGTFSNESPSNQVLMQWPCASGYHVPTQLEWCNAILAVSPDVGTCDAMLHTEATANKFRMILSLPLAGYRNFSTAGFGSQETSWNYWTASWNGVQGGLVYFTTSGVTPATSYNRASGYSVRCLKN